MIGARGHVPYLMRSCSVPSNDTVMHGHPGHAPTSVPNDVMAMFPANHKPVSRDRRYVPTKPMGFTKTSTRQFRSPSSGGSRLPRVTRPVYQPVISSLTSPLTGSSQSRV